MQPKDELLRKIEARQATVGIVGMGYVGLPLAVAFAQQGFWVTGIDVDEDKVSALNAGNSYIEDVADDVLRPLIINKQLRASTNYADIAQADAISICVPTPPA